MLWRSRHTDRSRRRRGRRRRQGANGLAANNYSSPLPVFSVSYVYHAHLKHAAPLDTHACATFLYSFLWLFLYTYKMHIHPVFRAVLGPKPHGNGRRGPALGGFSLTDPLVFRQTAVGHAWTPPTSDPSTRTSAVPTGALGRVERATSEPQKPLLHSARCVQLELLGRSTCRSFT
jgi:hypothetical protein